MAAANGPNGVFEGYPIVRVEVNGKTVSGDVPAINFNGRTMVPVRFVSEALGASVEWDANTWTASINLANAGQPPSQSPVQPPAPTASLTDRVRQELAAQLTPARVGGSDLRFTIGDVTPGKDFMGSSYVSATVTINESDYLPYLQLLTGGKRSEVEAWLTQIGQRLEAVCGTEYFWVFFFYHGTYSSYPSSYSPDEVRLSTVDYKWHVTHLFASVRNVTGSLKAELK